MKRISGLLSDKTSITQERDNRIAKANLHKGVQHEKSIFVETNNGFRMYPGA